MLSIETIKRHVTIADVYHAFGLSFDNDLLSKGGQFSCQIHGRDSHPSAHYYPETQSMHCFACGFRGDVIDVTKKLAGVYTTAQAIAWLVDRFKIDFEPAPVRRCGKLTKAWEDEIRSQVFESIGNLVWGRIDETSDFSLLHKFNWFVNKNSASTPDEILDAFNREF